MKKLFLIAVTLFFLFENAEAQGIQQNLPKLGEWDDDALPSISGITFNDIWGYSDPVAGEYAIMGSVLGTYFINVTDAAHPQLVAFFPGNDSIGINRDFKTYGHYAYGVCDQGNSSLQIFDLQNLPASVTKVYDSNALSIRCHTLFIENEKIFMCSNTTSSGYHSMDVLSLADPVNPTFVSTLSNPQFYIVHAAYVRNDTAFCSCGNDGLFVFDYTDPLNPNLIASFTSYPEKGYNHSSWTTEDGKTLIFTDETHGCGVKMFDITDLTNPILKSIFRSNLLGVADSTGPAGSIPHNPYIVGEKAVVSWYHDGVQVFDISDPHNPTRIAYYDTDPLNTDYSGYGGCWGVYPFLPSHHIIASDLLNGLFVLDGNTPQTLGTGNIPRVNNESMILFPNPSSGDFYFNANMKSAGELNYTICDVTGKKIRSGKEVLSQGNSTIKVSLDKVPAGMYFIYAEGTGFHYSEKIVLTN